MQKEVDILENDTLGTVYFDKLFPLGVEAMIESVDLVRAGDAPKIVQDDSQSTYESWCRKANVEIDWTRPAQEVHNLIRGADPAPGAWTTIGGTAVQLFESTRTEGVGGEPGEIVAVGEGRLVVAAGGGHVSVGRARPEGGGKVAADTYAGEAGIAPGIRAGS